MARIDAREDAAANRTMREDGVPWASDADACPKSIDVLLLTPKYYCAFQDLLLGHAASPGVDSRRLSGGIDI